jgi:hypothetical protein
MKQIQNNSEDFDSLIDSKHKNQLGFDIPENYFATAKQEILTRTLQHKHKQKNKSKQLIIRLSIAASVMLIILSGVFVWKHHTNNTTISEVQISNQLLSSNFNNSILFNSLFIEDDKISEYFTENITHYIISEELNTPNNNLFLNSLFVNDAELESYTLEILTL